jgi:uncharacterized protein (TIGR00369 family)
MGLVHGGVFASIAESITSLATALAVIPEGRIAQGLSNQTSFLRPITEGTIHAEARRRHRGRTTWVWEVEITDDHGRLCALVRMTIAVRDAAATPTPRRLSTGSGRVAERGVGEQVAQAGRVLEEVVAGEGEHAVALPEADRVLVGPAQRRDEAQHHVDRLGVEAGERGPHVARRAAARARARRPRRPAAPPRRRSLDGGVAATRPTA